MAGMLGYNRRMNDFDFIDFIRDTMAFLADSWQIILAVPVVVVGWQRAKRRLGRTADNCANRAMSVRHIGHGAINLNLGIKTAALVYTGHAPGVHIGPVAEMRID